MAGTDSPELTEDHISWLLAAAYNYLQQDMPDQAVTLLEFLHCLDESNRQCHRQCLGMLAYGYFLRGDARKSNELLQQLGQLPSLTREENTLVHLLQPRTLQKARSVDD